VLNWRFIVPCIGAALASYALVAIVRSWALRHMLDQPNARSSHTIPTPRGGGLAIAAAVAGGWLVAGLETPEQTRCLLQALLVVAVAALGWLDDLYSLSARLRLAFQVVLMVLTLLLWPPVGVIEVPVLGALNLAFLAWPLTLIGLLGLLNAYNFMDGIDGIAGTQGLVAGVMWIVMARVAGAPLLVAVALGCAGGCAGFLPHNWPRARIFMGDVGSTTLGYLFALLPVCTLELGHLPQSERVPFAALMAVWPFVLDAGLTFLRRLARGENVFAAHRSHLYQRCVIAGFPHARVTLLYGALALACSVSALLWVHGGDRLAAVAVLACLVLTPSVLLGAVAVAEHGRRTSPSS
jgi:UDP-N-acetylmuramyl pentapeptide phosphotransferase/UDP-N-acetylglucosamine-1-phosphate transferase